MKFTLFLTRYIAWHYGGGLKSFFATWGNIVWFAYHFFSIPLLFRTLFEPFQRLNEERKKGLDVGAIAAALTVNAIMRLVGAAARGFIIAMGVAALAFIFAAGAVLLVVWILLPFSVLTFIVLGLNGLLRA